MSIGATACVSSAASPALAAITVPAGSTLAMSRSVALAISTSNSAIPAGSVGQLEVRRDDGAVLYRGPMIANQSVTSKLALPTSEAKLKVVLHVAGKADASLEVAVASNAATASFQ